MPRGLQVPIRRARELLWGRKGLFRGTQGLLRREKEKWGTREAQQRLSFMQHWMHWTDGPPARMSSQPPYPAGAPPA